MSKQRQHEALRARNGSDYRLFRPQDFEYPTRVDSKHCTFDPALELTFIEPPDESKTCPPNERWLLVSFQALAQPSNWNKGSLEGARAAFAAYFGPSSSHNFAMRIPLTDPDLSPQHTSEVEGMISVMSYISDRQLDVLHDLRLAKVVIMTDNVYIVTSMTENVKAWRNTRPPFLHIQSTKFIQNRDGMMKLDDMIMKFEDAGTAVEFWYKAPDLNLTKRLCLRALDLGPAPELAIAAATEGTQQLATGDDNGKHKDDTGTPAAETAGGGWT